MRRIFLAMLLVLLPASASAQLWSSVLATARATDWTQAGATITNRSTVCSTTACNTVWAGTVTTATLNAAIASAPDDTVVRIPAGTFTISAGVNIARSNVTLRGLGASTTVLSITGGMGCNYPSVAFCINSGDSTSSSAPDNTATWSAGYTKGATSITISSKTNLTVGQLIFLDQAGEGATDTSQIWNCTSGDPACMTETIVPFWRNGTDTRASQVEVHTVTSISEGACPCVIGIEPGLHMPNWAAARTPYAGWSSTAPLTGIGIENLTVDMDPSGFDNLSRGVFFDAVKHSWLQGVRLIEKTAYPRSSVGVYWSARITIRDSYLFGTLTGESQHYGIETIVSSDGLVENNITDGVTIPLVAGQAAIGWVYGYNYSKNDTYTLVTGWMQASSYNHAAGNNYLLWEGNDGIGFTCDAIHGPSFMNTGFRNRWRGYDPEGGSVGGKTMQLVAIHAYRVCRYFNAIGNVLGEQTIHTAYEGYPDSASDNTNPVADLAVYQLGWASNQSSGGTSYNDLRVRATLMRWGNWDTVNDAARWENSEVPTGDAYYANTVPGSQTLPNSFYRSSAPSWFGSVGWPAIGPDVTGGTVADVGGHVKKIPARVCYEATSKTDGVLNFDAATCYGSAAPAAPTNVRIR